MRSKLTGKRLKRKWIELRQEPFRVVRIVSVVAKVELTASEVVAAEVRSYRVDLRGSTVTAHEIEVDWQALEEEVEEMRWEEEVHAVESRSAGELLVGRMRKPRRPFGELELRQEPF
jgi:hypothetical protein